MQTDNSDNWLGAKRVDCPSCNTALWGVDNSPMLDHRQVYCEKCPKSVEISFYDHVVDEIRDKFPPEKNRRGFFEELERHLKVCECSGLYKFDSASRCYKCSFIIEAGNGVNLTPFIGVELEDRDPTVQEQAIFDRWEREFVKVDDLWQ